MWLHFTLYLYYLQSLFNLISPWISWDYRAVWKDDCLSLFRNSLKILCLVCFLLDLIGWLISSLFERFVQVVNGLVCNLRYLFCLCFQLARFYWRMLLFSAGVLCCLFLFDLSLNYDFRMLFRNMNFLGWLNLFVGLFAYGVVETFSLKSLDANLRFYCFMIFDH